MIHSENTLCRKTRSEACPNKTLAKSSYSKTKRFPQAISRPSERPNLPKISRAFSFGRIRSLKNRRIPRSWRVHRRFFLKLPAVAASCLTLLNESISFEIFQNGLGYAQVRPASLSFSVLCQIGKCQLVLQYPI